MSTVTLVGRFRELGDDTADTLLYGRPSPHKAALVRYLRAGHPLLVAPGLERDVFDRSRRAGSRSILTDGTLAWYELLAYYVDRYDAALPAALEDHIVARRFEMPRALDVRALRLG